MSDFIKAGGGEGVDLEERGTLGRYLLDWAKRCQLQCDGAGAVTVTVTVTDASRYPTTHDF